MSNSKLSEKEQEELTKLENEAFRELGQIIAIAYQVQDIEYINNLILAWERKYQKLLSNPDFKKKFKKILDEAYDEVVKYILSRIRLKEEQVIKNQRKALNQLYTIIKDNYDLDTLKSKIKKWESKYPYDSFLKMYQKRIDSAKREKNLQENAFKQEEAFKDLYYGVVNRSGSLEELKEYLKKWEEKYSINDNFTIDDFIKHQSEVKRYTSNEFLVSIAKKEEKILDTITYPINNNTQHSAFKQLESIIKGKHSIDEVFKWVYKNNSIEFSDFYKQRIISIITFDYSPKFLKTLPIPDIDLSKPTLPLEQYTKINEIKRYAIISYFNLLLPQSEAISNNFFTEHIRTIYYETEKRKHSNIINTFKDEVTNFIPETVKEDKKIALDSSSTTNNIPTKTKNETNTDLSSITNDTSTEITNETHTNLNSINSNTSDKEEIKVTLNIENNILDIEHLISFDDEPNTLEIITNSETTKSIEENLIISKKHNKISNIEEHTILENQTKSSNNKTVETYETTDFTNHTDESFENTNKTPVAVSATEIDLPKEEPIIYESTINISSVDISKADSTTEEYAQNADYDTIITLSPVFFETINNYSIQADLIQTVADKTSEKSKTKSSIDITNDISKTRNQSE